MVSTPEHGYTSGAETLAKSIRASGSTKPLACMVTPNVPQDKIDRLEAVGYRIHKIGEISNPNTPSREWFLPTYSKLHIFEMTDYDKVVYMDADFFVIRNMDDLFDRQIRPYPLAAAPEIYPPTRFNSGLLVLHPNATTFREIAGHLDRYPSYDGGDQGVLNSYFPGWFDAPASVRLRTEYNALQSIDHYPPAWALIRPGIRAVHFCGQDEMKPWGKIKTVSPGVAVMVWLWRKVAQLPLGAPIDHLRYALDLTEQDDIHRLWTSG